MLYVTLRGTLSGFSFRHRRSENSPFTTQNSPANVRLPMTRFYIQTWSLFYNILLLSYTFLLLLEFLVKTLTISLSRCAPLLSFLYMYTMWFNLSAVILYCMFSFLVNFIFLSLTFFTLYLILYYLWFGETNKMKWKKFLFPMWVMLPRELDPLSFLQTVIKLSPSVHPVRSPVRCKILALSTRESEIWKELITGYYHF